MTRVITFKEIYEAYVRDAPELQPVPAGVYTLRVLSARNDGERMVIVPVYEIVDGPLAGTTVLAGFLPYADRARSIFLQRLDRFGMGEDYFTESERTGDEIACDLVGRTAVLNVEVGEDGLNRLALGPATTATSP